MNKEEKQAELIDSLVYQSVNTINGKGTLYNLIYKIGVSNKLEFKNGVTVRKISRAVFLLPFEFEHYIKVKERNSDYKPPVI